MTKDREGRVPTLRMPVGQAAPSNTAGRSRGGRIQGRLRREEAPEQGGRGLAVPDPAPVLRAMGTSVGL